MGKPYGGLAVAHLESVSVNNFQSSISNFLKSVNHWGAASSNDPVVCRQRPHKDSTTISLNRSYEPSLTRRVSWPR